MFYIICLLCSSPLSARAGTSLILFPALLTSLGPGSGAQKVLNKYLWRHLKMLTHNGGECGVQLGQEGRRGLRGDGSELPGLARGWGLSQEVGLGWGGGKAADVCRNLLCLGNRTRFSTAELC